MTDETTELTGRELDVAVAEMMGWRIWWFHGTPCGIPPDGRPTDYYQDLPHYSTDESACAEVREWVRDCTDLQGNFIFWSISDISDLWQAHVDWETEIDSVNYRPLGAANCESYTETVCRAALAAAPFLKRREE